MTLPTLKQQEEQQAVSPDADHFELRSQLLLLLLMLMLLMLQRLRPEKDFCQLTLLHSLAFTQ